MSEKKQNWFKRHKVLSIILGVVLLFIVIGVASSGSETNTQNASSDNNNSTESKDTSTDTSKPTEAKLNEAVRDGKFEFTVTSVKCGETSIGNEFASAKAQGQFCRVSLTIKNIGNEPQIFSESDQFAFNAEGQKYSTDTSASIYSSTDGSTSTWFNEINPGNTVTGDIFFDIPKDTSLTSLELHDSAFSGGVKISI